jgi:hypothetical protein
VCIPTPDFLSACSAPPRLTRSIDLYGDTMHCL